MNKISVDFGKIVGRIKPLHGVNNGPKSLGLFRDMSEHFVNAGIPYVRLHDTEYPYGSGQFVDIACVFPNFDADTEDPVSYNFGLTDEYIKTVQAVGAKIIYRLGPSIEHAPIKIHIFPPKDYEKWARICAGIIRHYNEGWANGFHYGIEYWEIWNEPENPPMWQGTQEEYFRLYVTAANHLKDRFPQIKVGGYAHCGFYALTRTDATDFQKSFIPYFTDFLRYITTPGTEAPLDFFSWHLYSDHVEEAATHAHYVQKTLLEYGFDKTENILDEWNYFMSGNDALAFQRIKNMVGASFVAGVFCALQKSPVQLATYYDAQPSMAWCGILDWSGPLKPFYAFKAFHTLYELGNEVPSASAITNVYACAAASDTHGAILLSNYSGESLELTVEVSGLEANNGVRLEFYQLDVTTDLECKRSEDFHGKTLCPVLTMPGNSVVLLKTAKL